jgi:GrpB-like predicted nucleotidyltransferase (UPF0157 family)
VSVTRDWPAWATEKVAISQWDATWPRRAAELISEVERLLDPWLADRVEHVGSTAVPGLAAKPVLDLMAPFRPLAGSEQADAVLAEAGWHLVPPELDQRPWRRLHVLAEADRRVAHLQLVAVDHPRWRETLGFRDELRQRPDLAAEYERVKRLAARHHEDDREAYTDAKTAFVRGVVRRL